MITNGTTNPVEVAISGGQFSHVVPAEYCAPGFEPITTPNAQGKYEVQDVRVYIFDGSTMSDMATSPSGAISWAKVGDVMSATDKSGTYDEVNYTKALQLGNSTTTKHFRIDVALNNAAKIEVIGMSNSSSDTRHAWLTNSTEKGEYASAIAGLATTGYNPEMFATDWLEEGSYYLHADNTVNIFLIRVTSKEVDPKCEQPTITPMADASTCEGEAFAPITVSASVSDEGTLHYQWYKVGEPDAAVGTDAASFTPEAAGQYYVVVTNRKEGNRDNSATSNTINAIYYAAAEITTAPLNKRGEVGDEVTLTVEATGKNVAYKWYTCDEDGSNEQAIVPAETGTSLNVTVTAGMAQWYKVKVTSDCGGAEAMAKVSEFVPTTPANVTNTILWDWKNSEAGFPTAASSHMDFINTSTEELFADVDAAMPNNEHFRSDMLYGIGQYAWRNKSEGEYGFQGFQIRFYTEVAGRVRVYFRAPSSGQTSVVTIDGKPAGSRGNSWGWSEYVDVDANTNVVIAMTNGENGMTRVQQIEFFALAHQRTSGYNVGDLGTVCLEDATFIEGASLYELQGLDEHGYLAFDEISTGELEAGKPYLFEVINPNKISFYKPLGAAHSDTEIETNGMIGTFAGTTLYQGAENYYYFSGRHIWRVNDFTVSIAIPAHRCYVDMDELQPVAAAAPAPGRRRVTLGVQGSQVVTGMENLNAGDQPVKVMINGQLVHHEPDCGR